MLHTNFPQSIVIGNTPIIFNEVVRFNTAGIAAGKKLIHLEADANRPCLVKVDVQVSEVFNAATTNVLTVGTDAASANQILGTADINETALGFYPTGAQTGKLVISQKTDIFVKFTQTGTAATTGTARVIVTVTPLFQGT